MILPDAIDWPKTQEATAEISRVIGTSRNSISRSFPYQRHLASRITTPQRFSLFAEPQSSIFTAEFSHNRVQIMSDGHKCNVEAIDEAFGGEVDFAQPINLYGNEAQNAKNPDTKYSPSECCGTKTQRISGQPDNGHTSTSFAEPQDLTLRMRMRRFTRLTNAFSKKIENRERSVALHFMVYNFVRPHQTLTPNNGGHNMTPAMAAGIASRVWTMADLIAMVDRITETESAA